MLQVKDLSVKYPNLNRSALQSITFEAKQGEFIVVAGPSGSGKSTLAQVLMTLIPNFTEAKISGEIKYKEKQILEMTRKDLIELLGFVPQYPSDYTTTLLVEEEVAFVLENLAFDPAEIKQRLDRIFTQLDIEHLRHKVFTEISSGELQRVFLASALVFIPPIIILDEPIARIDPKTEIKLVNILRDLADEGHLVIAFEHRLDYILSKADRLIILDEGKIISDDNPETSIHLLENIDPPELSLIEMSKKQKIISFDSINEKHDILFEKLQKESINHSIQDKVASKVSPTVSFDHVMFKYNKKQKCVLEDISIGLQSGQAIGLMGINGSGKSTLLKTLVGILKAKEGEIRIDDKKIRNIRQGKKSTVFLPENAKLFLVGPTPFKDLMRELKNQELVSKIFKKFELSRLMKRKLYHLSEGERRLFAIVNAFQFPDDIILLDEPTIALDKNGREILLNLIQEAKAQGKTIVIASNDSRIVSSFDSLIVISNGKILLKGDPRDVLYELEENTKLIPNQTVRLIQTMEKRLQTTLPHYLTPDEINDVLRRYN